MFQRVVGIENYLDGFHFGFTNGITARVRWVAEPSSSAEFCAWDEHSDWVTPALAETLNIPATEAPSAWLQGSTVINCDAEDVVALLQAAANL